MFQFDCHSERKLSEKMAEKLDHPFTAPKACWSIFNNFLGKGKTPNIPPLVINDFVVSDFTAKANILNNFFTSQCSPVVNSSTLPNFCYNMQKLITDIEIKEDDILLIIKNLNLNKAHGWDNVSVCMIQWSGRSESGLFESSLTAGIFPEDWKKGKLFQSTKKKARIA